MKPLLATLGTQLGEEEPTKHKDRATKEYKLAFPLKKQVENVAISTEEKGKVSTGAIAFLSYGNLFWNLTSCEGLGERHNTRE